MVRFFENIFWSLAYCMEKKDKLNMRFDALFGQHVKKIRESKGWSQAELAYRMENNHQNISRLEKGETTPTIYWCYRLAHVFEMDITELLKGLKFKIEK